MDEESQNEETAPAVDLSKFTSLEQFDQHIDGLKANPNAENLRLIREAVQARREFKDATASLAELEAELAAEQAAADEAAAEAAAQAEAEAAAVAEAEAIAEAAAGAPIEDQTDTDAEAAADAPAADPDLVAASLQNGDTADLSKAGTSQPTTASGGAPNIRRASLTAPMGQTWTTPGPITSNAKMAEALNKAVKGEGTASVFEFNMWDRSKVDESDILKAGLTGAQMDRILGVVDADGNEVEGGVAAPAALISKNNLNVHRATCGGCSGCDAILEYPDCFQDRGEPLGDSIAGIPADTCKWNVEPQKTLADVVEQQVYVYCGTDANGDPAAGILQADGTVVPIDPNDENTWKTVIDIETDCENRIPYSLEEFPLLFRVPRNEDVCNASSVQRELNRYLSLQSRFMEARKYAQIRAHAESVGHCFNLPAHLGDAQDDMVAFMNVITAIMDEQAGVEVFEGYNLAVPRGMVNWVQSRAQQRELVARLRGELGIENVVVPGSTGNSPYADAAYALNAGAKLDIDLCAEKYKTWSIVAYDPPQWRKPVGETVRIGVTDTFRDFDLAKMNARGIVIYRDETLLPVGCAPAIGMDMTLCASGVLPGRKCLDCDGACDAGAGAGCEWSGVAETPAG